MKKWLKMRKTKVLISTLVLSLIFQMGIGFADVTEADHGLRVIDNDYIASLSLSSASEGRILFYDQNEKYGYLDYEGNIAIEPTFEYAQAFSSGVARVELDGESAYIDMDGNIKFYEKDILAHYDLNEYSPEIYDFVNGYAKVDTYASTTYIDTDGNFIFPQDAYYDGNDFYDGIVQVYDESYNGEYINAEGEVIFSADPNYEYYNYSNDLALVYGYNEGQYGYVNKAGETVIPLTLDDANSFVGDKALYQELGLYGVIDSQGKFLVYPSFKEAEITQDGYVLGYDGIFTVVLDEQMKEVAKYPGNQMYNIYDNVMITAGTDVYEFKDLSGAVLGEFQDYYYLGDHLFDTGYGQIIDTSSVDPLMGTGEAFKKKYEYDFYFIDNTGQVRLDVSEYDDVRPFSEGLAVVEKNGKFGYINQEGQLVIPIKYLDADDFVDGSAYVETITDYRYIDTAGNEVESAYDYDTVEESENYYVISTGYYGDEGVADRSSGRIILEPKYYSVSDMGDGLFEIMDENYNYGFFNAEAGKLVEPQYSYIEYMAQTGDIYVENDAYLSGVIDPEGNTVLEMIYDNISVAGTNLYTVEADGYYGVVDKSGTPIVKPMYDYIDTLMLNDRVLAVSTELDYQAHSMLYDMENGKIITDDIDGYISDYRSEIIVVETNSGDTQVLDFEGNEIIEVEDYLSEIDGAFMLFMKEDGTYYLADKEGTRYLEDNDFDMLFLPVEDEYIIYSSNQKYGIVNLSGEKSSNKTYSIVSYLNSGVMSFFEDDAFGYVSVEGDNIIEPGAYDFLYNFTDGMGLVIKMK